MQTKNTASFSSHRYSGLVPPNGKTFWEEASLKKFKELVNKASYEEPGIIAVQKGIRHGPIGDCLSVLLIKESKNKQETGIQIHEEMMHLKLADWKPEGNDEGYSSSPFVPERVDNVLSPFRGYPSSGKGEARDVEKYSASCLASLP